MDVPFRLIRSDDVPATNPEGLAYRFGLQNTRGEVLPGVRDAEGRWVFEFVLRVKEGKGAAGPVFAGEFASGPVTDRFVYLSWLAVERGGWINRVKARLGNVSWDVVRQAQATGQRVTADMTGWTPHDMRKAVAWYLS